MVWLTTFEIHHLKNQRFCFDSSPWCWYLFIILQGEDIGRRFNKNNLREQRLCHAYAGSKKNKQDVTCCILEHDFKNLGGVSLLFAAFFPWFASRNFDGFHQPFHVFPICLYRFPWCSSIVSMFVVISHDFSQVSMLCSALFDGFHRFIAGFNWFVHSVHRFLSKFVSLGLA